MNREKKEETREKPYFWHQHLSILVCKTLVPFSFLFFSTLLGFVDCNNWLIIVQSNLQDNDGDFTCLLFASRREIAPTKLCLCSPIMSSMVSFTMLRNSNDFAATILSSCSVCYVFSIIFILGRILSVNNLLAWH